MAVVHDPPTRDAVAAVIAVSPGFHPGGGDHGRPPTALLAARPGIRAAEAPSPARPRGAVSPRRAAGRRLPERAGDLGVPARPACPGDGSQSSAELSSEVSPPSRAHSIRWWTSHHQVGASQPANTQPPVAVFDGAADVRRGRAAGSRPTSSGRPSGSSTIRVRSASQAAQRARAAERTAPKPASRGGRGPVAGSTRSSRSMLITTCGLTLRQQRQRCRRPGCCRPSCTRRVAVLLAAAAGVAGGAPGGLRDGLQRRCWTFSPPTASRSNAAGDRVPSGCGDRRCSVPPLGRVGFGAVGIQPVEVVLARAARPVGVRAGWWRRRPASASIRGQIDALRRRPAARCSGRRRSGRSQRRCSAVTAPAARADGQRRQVVQRPPVADQPGRGGRRQPGVPAQPGGHRPQPVALRAPRSARHGGTVRASSASIRSRAATSSAVRSSSTVSGSAEGSSAARPSRAATSSLDTPPTARTHVRRIPVAPTLCRMNPQVSGLSTDLGTS